MSSIEEKRRITSTFRFQRLADARRIAVGRPRLKDYQSLLMGVVGFLALEIGHVTDVRYALRGHIDPSNEAGGGLMSSDLAHGRGEAA